MPAFDELKMALNTCMAAEPAIGFRALEGCKPNRHEPALSATGQDVQYRLGIGLDFGQHAQPVTYDPFDA